MWLSEFKVAESWEAFFDLVYSVTREAEVKVNANSSGDVLESMSQKIEHCMNGVARLDPFGSRRILYLPAFKYEKSFGIFVREIKESPDTKIRFKSLWGNIAHASSRVPLGQRGRPCLSVDVVSVLF